MSSFSDKLTNNKQLVHIVSEVIVLLGITFYFSSQNRKLTGHIEELAQQIEEQEDRLLKLEQGMTNIVPTLRNLMVKIDSRENPPP